MNIFRAKEVKLPLPPHSTLDILLTVQGGPPTGSVAIVMGLNRRLQAVFTANSRTQKYPLSSLQGDYILIGQKYTEPKAASARLLTLTGEDQSFYLDIDEGQRPAPGHAYLAGTFPDGITKVEGLPASLEVRVLYRPESGAVGDGALVKSVMSNPDGTWLVEGLDHSLRYDVVCRGDGYNDQIWSNVTPKLATGLEFVGRFTTLYDQVEILLGVGPYQVDVVGGTPPDGVAFTAQGGFVVAVGDSAAGGEFIYTLRVIDSNGLSGVFESTTNVAYDPHWWNVVSLLHFDDGLADEKGALWDVYDDALLETSNPVFGTGSLSLPGTSGYVETGTPVFSQAGSQDVTIELYLKLRSPMRSGIVFDFRASNNDGRFPVMYYQADGRLQFQWETSVRISSDPGVIKPEELTHVAYVREAGVHKAFVNGVQVGTYAHSGAFQSTSRIRIGRSVFSNSTHFADSLYDEFRITVGVARYTENFTPPTEPFPNRGQTLEQPLPTVIGEPYGGGFYAGDIQYPSGQWYKLIVADKVTDIRGVDSRWKTANSSTAGTDSTTDGVANTSSMIMAGIELHPAANHCVNHTGGDNSDWYMPATDELDVIYQNLGFNRPNCPADFLNGGAQSFTSAFYRTSTEISSSANRVLQFSSGDQSTANKSGTSHRVRPVRRIAFTPEVT